MHRFPLESRGCWEHGGIERYEEPHHRNGLRAVPYYGVMGRFSIIYII